MLCLAELFVSVDDTDDDDDDVDMKPADAGRREKAAETEVHPPPQIATLTTTIKKFPGIPHQWLCEGRLLHLVSISLKCFSLSLTTAKKVRVWPLQVFASRGQFYKTFHVFNLGMFIIR